MMEILRQPYHAERELTNALACVSEAIVVLNQYLPASACERRHWLHQIKKLRMAYGLCRNVRDKVTRDVAFESLRGARKADAP